MFKYKLLYIYLVLYIFSFCLYVLLLPVLDIATGTGAIYIQKGSTPLFFVLRVECTYSKLEHSFKVILKLA